MASTERRARSTTKGRTAQSTVFPTQRAEGGNRRTRDDFDILADRNTASTRDGSASARSSTPSRNRGQQPRQSKQSNRRRPTLENPQQSRFSKLWEQTKESLSIKQIVQHDGRYHERTKPVLDVAKRGGYQGARMLFNPLWCYHCFVGVVMFLTFVGVIMVFSSSSITMLSSAKSPWSQGANQAMFCALGLLLCALGAHIQPRVYRGLSGILLIISWFVQLLTLTPIGVEINGNRGWINIGFTTVQPAEFMKLAVCIWMPLAVIIAKSRAADTRNNNSYAVPIIMLGICCALVMLGKDMGTTMIVLIIGVIALLLGGMPGKWFWSMVVLAVVASTALIIQSPNRLARVTAAYTKCGTATGFADTCYQSVHAKYALASGGFLGVGIGNSREKWNYLPEAHNDFIFAIIGEELGFVGTVMIVLLFVILGWCLLCVALQATDRYTAMVLMCITVWILGQAMVNIMVVIGLLPVMGVPLPFVSAGGSSLVMCLGAAGVAMSMMRQQAQIATATDRLSS